MISRIINIVKQQAIRFKDFLVKFSDKPIASILLFLHSLIDSIFFPISIDFVYIPMLIAKPQKAYLFAILATIGSIAGAIVAYLIGYAFMDSVGTLILQTSNFEAEWASFIKQFNNGISLWSLTIAALTPIPFSLASIASGAVGMNFVVFLLISIFGRATRFVVIAIIIKNYKQSFRKLKRQITAIYKKYTRTMFRLKPSKKAV